LENVPAGHPEHDLLAFINPALGQKKGKPAGAHGALMGDDWEPLPQAEKQAPALEKIYPPPAGRVLVGAEAREKVFKEEAAEASILHFATHGVLDDRAPLYSYLLLSQENIAPDQDGRLETRELMQLKLHARLAVLCGCETARGQVTAGEGVVGLSWGFFVAGCPATIVSQWKVDSASSTPLMIELHRQLHRGAGNAEALRSASLELRKDARYRHPFYWAPFVLVGASLEPKLLR
jgi:CHAT domain-containing protein